MMLSLILGYNYIAPESDKRACIERVIAAGKRYEDMLEIVMKKDPPDYMNISLLYFFIYSLIQMAIGDLEGGRKTLLLFEKKELYPYCSLAALQLGIMYYYGDGVDEDREKANKYFTLAKKPLLKSGRIAQGYCLFYGLDVVKDEAAALSSKNGYFNNELCDDVRISLKLLSPEIATKLREVAAEQLLQEVENEITTKKKKGKQNKKSKEQSSKSIEKPSSSNDTEELIAVAETAATINDSTDWKIILGTAEIWNDWFKVSDGSRVIAIDYDNQIIIIDDPQNHEQLELQVQIDPNAKRRFIPPFVYHQRISLRQDLARSGVTPKIAYDHRFAQMLDYVMQQFGMLVPLLKMTGTIEEQLVADVVRIDAQGNRKLCRAEYSFGRNNGKVYVYHRLLRPVKNKTMPSAIALPSSSGAVGEAVIH